MPMTTQEFEVIRWAPPAEVVEYEYQDPPAPLWDGHRVSVAYPTTEATGVRCAAGNNASR